MAVDGLKIKTLKPEQWKDFRSIRLEALQTAPEAFGTRYEDMVDQPETKWREWLGADYGLKRFAYVGDEVIAMAGVFYEETFAHIIAVYTKPAYRGKGVSGVILTSLIDQIKAEGKVSRIQLEVNQTATGAIRSYEKLGFKTGTPIPDFVRSDGESFPEYQMYLSIN